MANLTPKDAPRIRALQEQLDALNLRVREQRDEVQVEKESMFIDGGLLRPFRELTTTAVIDKAWRGYREDGPAFFKDYVYAFLRQWVVNQGVTIKFNEEWAVDGSSFRYHIGGIQRLLAAWFRDRDVGA